MGATVDCLATGAALTAALRFALDTTPVSPECRRSLVVHGVHKGAEQLC